MLESNQALESDQATERQQLAAPANDLARRLDGRELFVASNRSPVRFRLRSGQLEARPAAGGLVSALTGLASYVPLTWIAAAMEPAERAAARQRCWESASLGPTQLRLVQPSEQALNWSYRRFANPVLWFLQHGLWDELARPDLAQMIDCGWRLGYHPVNEAFARTIAEQVRGAKAPIVQIHDYHLYLAPLLLRRAAPHALIDHFTHIPWPEPEAWLSLPVEIRRDLCEGLLAADRIGFQTPASAANFLQCCERFVPGARINETRWTVWLEGRRSQVGAYPISVDPAALRRQVTSQEVLAHKERLRSRRGRQTIVRVDRMDPSKNIALGFRAFGLLLERRPDLVGQVRLLAFLVPSRMNIAEYRRYAQEVQVEAEAVNARFGRNGWTPIKIFYEDNRSQALAGMALADVLLVNPVADGMNLVAKEGAIVGERDPVLVLSQACGAHGQLGSAALSIPPRDAMATAAALEQALDMSADERTRRARRLRAAVEAEDLSWWLRRQLDDLLD